MKNGFCFVFIFLLSACVSFKVNAQVIQADRDALEAIFVSNNPTVNWDFSDPANNPISTGIWDGIIVGGNRIISLDLRNTAISGTVSNRLNDLTALSSLRLDNNQITSVPSLDSLVNLVDLYLGNNPLTTISNLNNLSSLRNLDLRNSQLITLPSLNDLTALETFIAFSSQLESLPSLDNLTSLRTLSASFNQLTSLPSLTNLTNLEQLICTSNNLSTLPNINPLTSLTELRCENNLLTFADLEEVALHPLYANFSANFFYIPQQPSILITSNNNTYNISTTASRSSANDGNSVTFSIPSDGVSTTYEWEKDANSLSETLTELTFTADAYDLNGIYEVVLNHPTLTQGTINTLPHTFNINGIDAQGGKFNPQQLIIEFKEEAFGEAALANNMAEAYNARVVDRCDCSAIIQVWEFCELLGTGGIYYDNDDYETGTPMYSNDINEIKTNGPPEETCIDNASYNYYTKTSDIKSFDWATFQPKKVTNTNNTSSLKIAIIDSGIRKNMLNTHGFSNYTDWLNTENCTLPQINSCAITNPTNQTCNTPPSTGYNFVNSCENADDGISNSESGNHGTEMAAIMLHQIPDNVELMNLKAFGTNGKGTLFDAICAIYFASQNQADIINLSWSYQGEYSSTLENALSWAAGERLNSNNMPNSHPSLIFASAGNGLEGERQDLDELSFFPAAVPNWSNMLTIAASNGTALTPFSNYSDILVEVAAPGSQIQAGIGTPAANGTSSATAFVSGMAAAYWCENYNEITNPSQVIAALNHSIESIQSNESDLGWGGQLLPLSASISFSNLGCNVIGNGTAEIVPIGGVTEITDVYNYVWSTGETDASIIVGNSTTSEYSVTVTDDGGVQFVANLIPDTNFEQTLVDQGIDKDGVVNGLISKEDAEAVTILNVAGKNINDLTGIGAFVNMTTLNCIDNNLTCLDLSKNLNLSILYCYQNYSLSDLNISDNNLYELDCSGCDLSNIDLASSFNLNSLWCASNELTELDLNNNNALLNLHCYDNSGLTNLDLSNLPDLTYFSCYGNNMTSLDMSNNLSIQEVSCQNNSIRSLDLSNHPLLHHLDCSYNNLTSLNIQNGSNENFVMLYPPYVGKFDARNNDDLSCITVDDADWADMNLTDIDEETCFSEDCSLGCESVCTDCTPIPDPMFENYLIGAMIDTDNIPGQVLTASIESITTLDVSGQAISNLEGIQDFVALANLDCSNNDLNSLDLSNNTNLTTLNALGNTNLSCIQVNNVNTANNWTSMLETGVIFSVDCNNEPLTAIPDANFEQELMDLNLIFGTTPDGQVYTQNIADISTLNVSGSNISNMTGIENFTNLMDLNCSNNNISSLNLSSNTNLTTINCNTNNSLSSLFIQNSNNTAITTFDASNHPNLSCITVDNPSHFEGINPNIDIDVCFKTNCTNGCSDDVCTTVEPGYTSIPDPLFAQALINSGLDVSNGQILTASAADFFGQIDITGFDVANLNGIEVFTNLRGFICEGNTQLTSLDLSNNIKLRAVTCKYMAISIFNIRNGSNYLIPNNRFNITQLPNLNCIQVDNSNNWTAPQNIDFLPNCLKDCSKNLVLVNDECNNSKHEIGNRITSTSAINGESDIIYQSVTDITLNPNFTVKLGARFTAFSSNKDCKDTPNNLAVQENEGLENNLIEKNKKQKKVELKVHPNPMNQTATLTFSIAEQEQLSILIYNHLGSLVKTEAMNQNFDAGTHQQSLQVHSLPNGLYYCVLQSAHFKQSEKLLVLRGH